MKQQPASFQATKFYFSLSFLSIQVEDLPTVDGFLHSLGLEKYAINFKAEEVGPHLIFQSIMSIISTLLGKKI